jgi:endonuclease G
MEQNQTFRKNMSVALRGGLAALCCLVAGCQDWKPGRGRAGENESWRTSLQPTTVRPLIYGGTPRFTNELRVLTNQAYVVGYDEARLNPGWAAYRLIKGGYTPDWRLRHSYETDFRTQARISPEDYTNTGYLRGQLAPAFSLGYCYGKLAQAETYLMSNVTPQSRTLSDVVLNRLEKKELEYARRFKELWVITGPFYGKPFERFPNGLEVPKGAFKIMVAEVDGRPRAQAFLVPQDVTGKEEIAAFLVSVDEVQQATGLEFFPEFPGDLGREIKTAKADQVW